MAELRTIRLHLDSNLYDIDSAEIHLFPLYPPVEIEAQVESGEQAYLRSAPVSDNIAEEAPVYGPGQYIAAMTHVVFKQKHGDQKIVVPAFSLPLLSLGQEDLDNGEWRVAIRPPGWIRVKLIDSDGRPILGQIVEAWSMSEADTGVSGCSGETDAYGSLLFDVPVGRYRVSVAEGETREVSIRDDFEEVTVTLRRPAPPG